MFLMQYISLVPQISDRTLSFSWTDFNKSFKLLTKLANKIVFLLEWFKRWWWSPTRNIIQLSMIFIWNENCTMLCIVAVERILSSRNPVVIVNMSTIKGTITLLSIASEVAMRCYMHIEVHEFYFAYVSAKWLNMAVLSMLYNCSFLELFNFLWMCLAPHPKAVSDKIQLGSSVTTIFSKDHHRFYNSLLYTNKKSEFTSYSLRTRQYKRKCIRMSKIYSL